MKRFWVERFRDGQWKQVQFAESNSVQYCHGYLDAMSSMYPSDPYRICKAVDAATFRVIREEKGKGKVHVN